MGEGGGESVVLAVGCSYFSYFFEVFEVVDFVLIFFHLLKKLIL